MEAGTHTLKYRMRAAYAGRYTVLPAWAGMMYNEEIHGTGIPMLSRVAP